MFGEIDPASEMLYMQVDQPRDGAGSSGDVHLPGGEGVIVAAAEVPAPEPELEPPPPHPAPRRGRPAGVHAARLAHQELGADIRGDGLPFLKYDTQLNILSAHCKLEGHGRFCRLNRTLNANPRKSSQGRPCGVLLAWLACANNHLTAAAHMDHLGYQGSLHDVFFVVHDGMIPTVITLKSGCQHSSSALEGLASI